MLYIMNFVEETAFDQVEITLEDTAYCYSVSHYLCWFTCVCICQLYVMVLLQ